QNVEDQGRRSGGTSFTSWPASRTIGSPAVEPERDASYQARASVSAAGSSGPTAERSSGSPASATMRVRGGAAAGGTTTSAPEVSESAAFGGVSEGEGCPNASEQAS